jgi:hypothetical protein
MKHIAQVAATKTTLDRHRAIHGRAVAGMALVRMLSSERAVLTASLVSASRGPTQRTTP